MMNYRILGRQMEFGKPNYRGLFRKEPYYIEKETDPELFQLWSWYATEAGDAGFIHDIKLAKRVVEAYRKRGESFEIVLVSFTQLTEDGVKFLGIDVASIGGYSQLYHGLEYSLFTQGDSLSSSSGITAILKLVQMYFTPLLNKHCLFDNLHDARLFLNIISEIRTFCPGAFEEDITIDLYFLYKV